MKASRKLLSSSEKYKVFFRRNEVYNWTSPECSIYNVLIGKLYMNVVSEFLYNL